jgi:demethylmenaquinone methyltransferase/2-methoxy-6-polyprenyl-1,4-benzoquinol methylase
MSRHDFFNSLAEKWDESNHYDFEKIELLLRLLNIKQGDRVLDVGTGTGVILPFLSKFTREENITAIDAAQKMIETAQKKFCGTKITFVCGDILDYPFAPDSFDHVICYSVFPHFEEKSKTIERISGILKTGGLFSILHSASKERINGVHIHARHEEINSDYLLPAARYIPLANKLSLSEEIMIDNNDMYMFAARKVFRRERND